jgi:photosystem II stability/assembly factor-like uncharacterized protein
MKRFLGRLASLTPLAIIAGLLYAALYVKPNVASASVVAPVIERRDQFYGVAAPDAQTIWAVGNDGKIVRSNDRGRTWTAQPSNVRATLQAIAAWDTRQAVVVGADLVLRTIDAGATWQRIPLPAGVTDARLLRVRAYRDGQAWAVGEQGIVLRTADHGATWERVRILAAEKDLTWNDVAFSGDNGCVAGEFGQIACSTTGGRSWSVSKVGVESSLMAIRFAGERRLIAVGLDGVAVQSDDVGVSWTRLATQTREHLFDLRCDGDGWSAIGLKGVIVLSDKADAAPRAIQLPNMRTSWFTSSEKLGNGYVLAGSILALVEDTGMTRLGERN